MRVKFPATVQFMRLGYEYQSLKDADIHPETRIFLNRFVPAIQRINSDKNLTVEQILATIEEIHGIIKNNDMGKEFLGRLLDQTADIKLIDFDHPEDNDFAVVDELTFGPEAKGSFRPDINILVNGIPLGFLEVKKPNTIEMYLKEMEDDFNDDSDEHFSLAGLVIGPEDIDKKYHAYQAHMNTLVDTSVNLELFSQQLVKLDRDTLLAIRRDLNGIKDCRTEFLLSRAMTLAAQIDEDRIKKLLREVQNRIDFLNLTTKPIDLMTVVSNEEVVKIVYEFFKVKISIMDMSKLTKAFKDVSDIDGYKQFTDAVTDIQKEIRRNKNTGAEKIVSLEDLLKKIFVELEYIDLNNLSEVNGKLLKILEDLRCINEENERLAARYGGNYAFVKTYSDVVEMHPEFDKEDLAKLTDVAYAAVKDIEGSNILILHGRESFVNTVKKNTTTQLLKSGLYKKLNLKDWYADFLGETYSNMRIF